MNVSRDLSLIQDEDEDMGDDDNDVEFQVASTGLVWFAFVLVINNMNNFDPFRAHVTLHSAISHLAHFCAVIPNASHVGNRPLYGIDPAEFAEGWHSFDGHGQSQGLPYTGPYGSSATLP